MVKRKRNKRDDDEMFIDEGKVKYIGRSRERKSLDELSVIGKEERGSRIEESRFRRRWRI